LRYMPQPAEVFLGAVRGGLRRSTLPPERA
jgi:hypothetical protein